MKQLLIILLAGIYALSVFGMDPASLYCCEKATVTESAVTIPAENNNCCNNPEQGFTNTSHHIGAAAVHFSVRSHTAQQPAGMLAKAASIASPRSFIVTIKNAEPVAGKAIPLYRLHCVYRI